MNKCLCVFAHMYIYIYETYVHICLNQGYDVCVVLVFSIDACIDLHTHVHTHRRQSRGTMYEMCHKPL